MHGPQEVANQVVGGRNKQEGLAAGMHLLSQGSSSMQVQQGPQWWCQP